MKLRFRKILKVAAIVIIVIFAALISLLLYVSRDGIKADLTNIDDKLTEYYNPKRMGGFAVAVFSPDSIIYMKGYGYADTEKSFPYTTQTQQVIASISKTTIGVALLKAEELGFLSINDPINKHLPFTVVNPQHPNTAITIEHLATHTSSLDYNEAVVEALYLDGLPPQRSLETFMVKYFENGDYGEVMFTNHAPGTNWNYSNIGASLAAYVVEVVSGMTFDEFTAKYIFSPLALNHTVWFEAESDSVNYVQYYELAEDSIQVVGTSGVKLYPSRDMITNIQDLTNYCQAIMRKDVKLLSKDGFDKLLRPSLSKATTNRTVDNSGLFFMIDKNQYGIPYRLTGMNGGDYCINTMMWFNPKTQLGYIFIGNTGQSDTNRVNHILIYQALVSLGDRTLYQNAPPRERIRLKWHNIASRIKAIL